jgi:hypothetical protein
MVSRCSAAAYKVRHVLEQVRVFEHIEDPPRPFWLLEHVPEIAALLIHVSEYRVAVSARN